MGTSIENNKKQEAEIDTSAPFESVKEAANLFGGRGFWKPNNNNNCATATANSILDQDGHNIEEQLQTDLIEKERETFDVLKELETTKNIVQQLKLQLQKEASEITIALEQANLGNSNLEDVVTAATNQCPTSILLELKQAKLNLTKTTTDLAHIRSTVDLYNNKIDKERLSLEKTRQRLLSNASKISLLQQELNQTKQHKAQVQKTNDIKPHDPSYFTRELQKLSSETEQFKKVGEAAKYQVLKAMSEIEQTKDKIRTAEIRLVAAKKMKQAARASEALALAEIKALSKCEVSDDDNVILTFEEYSSLVSKAREADQACKGRVEDATLKIDEANVSKTEILKKVEQATEEVIITKKSLEEALSRVEIANQGKLAVEEAMRKWRSEHGQKRRSVHNTTNFKNSHPSVHRKEPRLIEANGMNSDDELKPVLKPTLSIGQILSRKLLLTEDFKNGGQVDKSMCKHNVSLAQMLSKPKADDPHSAKKTGKENSEPTSAKRKKFGFARISRLVTKQSKKKKKLSVSSTRQSV